MSDPFVPLTQEEIESLQPAVIKLLRGAAHKFPCLDDAEFLNQVDDVFTMALASLSLPTPGCGHPSQYAYSEDGGKRIVCLLCERAARPEVDANLAAEINRVWIHGCCQGHGEPVDDVATLTKRVRWIGSQLDCAQTNFRVTNAAYCKLDEETRALRSPQKTMEKS